MSDENVSNLVAPAPAHSPGVESENVSNLVAPAPAHCPGVESENAGKSSACEGCPNQSICGSSNKGTDAADTEAVNARATQMRHKLLVLSGKGGVGKSTFAAQLAYALAERQGRRWQVGLLDVDICGPSVPTLLGLCGEQIHHSNLGWSPVYVDDNLGVMSVGFLLHDAANEAVIWRGPKKNGLIKQFVRDVDWGPLDFLVVDAPPGTSDEHLSLVALLKASGIDGALIVTTPQEVSLMDVRKEINFCRKSGINVLGVVENMSGFVCPSCKNETQIFKPSSGGAAKMCQEMGVPFLGAVPIDPRIARACDEGKFYLSEYPDSPATKAFAAVFDAILDRLEPATHADAMQQD